MINLTTADNALKNVYLEVINNQLNNDLDPFYSKITKTSNDIAGNTIKKLVTVGMNGGIGAGAEDGSLPIAQENNYVQLTASLKNLYAQLEITDKAVRASQSDSGAFLNLLNSEMDNLIESSKYNFRSMLYGDGSGYLGTCIDWTNGSAVFTVADPRLFVVGMKVNGFKDMIIQSAMKNAEVLAVNYQTGEVTLSPFAAATVVFDEDIDISFYEANNPNPITGLGAILETSGSLYGLERAKYPLLMPNSTEIRESQLSYVDILKVIDDQKINFNANIDMIVAGYGARRSLQKLLKTNSINCDMVNLDGGVRAITMNGVPVIANKFVEDGMIRCIDSSVFALHQLCDWTWMANDKGQVLRQKQGFAAHTATLVKYCELICSRVCNNTTIQVELGL